MSRKKEALGSATGGIAGAFMGAKAAMSIYVPVGIVSGPVGMAGVVPAAIIGGVVGLVAGKKVGCELDRK